MFQFLLLTSFLLFISFAAKAEVMKLEGRAPIGMNDVELVVNEGATELDKEDPCYIHKLRGQANIHDDGTYSAEIEYKGGACKTSISARLVFREIQNAKMMSSISVQVKPATGDAAAQLGSDVEIACGKTRWFHGGGTARACTGLDPVIEKSDLLQQAYPNLLAKPGTVQKINFNYEAKLNAIACYQGTIENAVELIQKEPRFTAEPDQEMIVTSNRLQSSQDDSQSNYTRILPFGTGLPLLRVSYRMANGRRNANRWYELKACAPADIEAATEAAKAGSESSEPPVVGPILHIGMNPENSFPAKR